MQSSNIVCMLLRKGFHNVAIVSNDKQIMRELEVIAVVYQSPTRSNGPLW